MPRSIAIYDLRMVSALYLPLWLGWPPNAWTSLVTSADVDGPPLGALTWRVVGKQERNPYVV
jgi:hypothetical protein